MAQPMGELHDWKAGDGEPVPGKTFPNVSIVTRDYTKIADMYTTLGPKVAQPGGYGAKGIKGDLSEVYEELKESYLVGEKDSRRAMDDARQVAEVILRISPESDGEVSTMLFKSLEKRTAEAELTWWRRSARFATTSRSHLSSPGDRSPHRTGRPSRAPDAYCPWTSTSRR
jgi:nitrate reductase alpha subunit